MEKTNINDEPKTLAITDAQRDQYKELLILNATSLSLSKLFHIAYDEKVTRLKREAKQ